MISHNVIISKKNSHICNNKKLETMFLVCYFSSDVFMISHNVIISYHSDHMPRHAVRFAALVYLITLRSLN